MTLLIQVAAVLACSALAVRILGSGARSSLSAGATVVAIVVAGLGFWGSVWRAGAGLVDRHGRDERLSAAQARALPGARFGAREDFLAWADRNLPVNARVFLECPQPANCSNALANWITYRLEPRVFVDRPAQAAWIVFYATPPTALATPGGSAQTTYAPGFALVRVA